MLNFRTEADKVAGKRLRRWSYGLKLSGSDGVNEFLDDLMVCSSMEFHATVPLEVIFFLRY